MVGSVNYPSPVTVNGYSCRNCTEVDYAKKHIDPSDPAAGPFGMNKTQAAKAKAHPSVSNSGTAKPADEPSAYSASARLRTPPAIGGLIDMSA